MLSVVIVSWNVCEPLRACLSALREDGSGCVGEVFVVDNASSDGTAEAVAAEFPEVRLTRNRENLGFARACNQALRVATGDFVCLLNPDTEVCPGALGDLVDFMETHPTAGAAGPCLLNPDGTVQPNGGPFPALAATFLRATRLSALRRRWFERRYCWGREDFSATVQVDQLSGACLVLRRAALDAVGLLDEEFFLYYEEVDWLLRARRLGWQTWYVPSSRVTHRWGASTKQLPDAALRHLAASQRRYFARHSPTLLRPLAWLLPRLELASHLLARKLRRPAASTKS